MPDKNGHCHAQRTQREKYKAHNARPQGYSRNSGDGPLCQICCQGEQSHIACLSRQIAQSSGSTDTPQTRRSHAIPSPGSQRISVQDPLTQSQHQITDKSQQS